MYSTLPIDHEYLTEINSMAICASRLRFCKRKQTLTVVQMKLSLPLSLKQVQVEILLPPPVTVLKGKHCIQFFPLPSQGISKGFCLLACRVCIQYCRASCATAGLTSIKLMRFILWQLVRNRKIQYRRTSKS